MVPIREKLVPSWNYDTKCPFSMTPTRLVIHNTGNKAPAENEITYMINNGDEVSFHYAVDDKEIVQGIPETRNAWHAGDGGGPGNRQGIGIEICYFSCGGPQFDAAERNAAEFSAHLLKKYGWGLDKVTKHQDYDGKYCPHRTLDLGWERFLNMVGEYLTSTKKKVNYRVRVTATDGLNLRSAPNGTILQLMEDGTVLDVIAEQDGWGESKTGGWFFLEYSEKVNSTDPPKPTTKSRVLQTIANDLSRGFGNGHDGVDLCWDTNPNEPITAHSEGTVTYLQTGYGNDTSSEDDASYGNLVKLKHPNGYFTLYAHLDTVKVGRGESVKRGQVIGTMGNTGNSYGNHLHFEVHNANGTKIDPAPYLNADLPGLPTADPTPAPETPKEEPMSYQDFCKMMAQYEQEKQQKPESDWSVKEGWWVKATAAGFFDGTMPRNGVTREQLAAVLGRAGLLDVTAQSE